VLNIRVTVPLLGSLTGTINLAVFVGTTPATTGVVGRVHLTLGSNTIPGLRFNGQFLLEINTFSTAQTVQTFEVDKTGGVFSGFKRNAAGQLVVTTQQITVTSGFQLLLAGSLVIGDRLTVEGSVQFKVQAGADPLLELVVNGRIELAGVGTLTLTDSGLRVSRAGLVARVQVSLSAGDGLRGLGLSGSGVSISVFLALNTTGRATSLGGSTVEPGFVVRIQGTITLLSISASGFVEIRAVNGSFELLFALQFSVGGLEFSANGGAGVYADGFALRLAVHARAELPVFTIDARGEILVNTTGQERLGISRNTFVLDVRGSVSLLKVLSFDAALRIAFTDGNWRLDASADIDFFGIARLSGTVFLDSKGNFRVRLSGRMALGSDDFGLVGSFSIEVRSTFDEPSGIYTFRLAGSASVRVRAFGITLAGVGLSFSVSVSGSGRVPIVLEVTVVIETFLGDIEKTARFTIGYLTLPRPLRLAEVSGGVLTLNVGTRANVRNLAPTAAEEPIDEAYILEQLAPGRVKVTAFGRSQVFDGVSSVVGNFDTGQDSLVVLPGATFDVTADGGPGIDSLSSESSGNNVLRGGADGDYLSLRGRGELHGDGDPDVLVHLGGRSHALRRARRRRPRRRARRHAALR
jgi:hypothetical protein